MKITGGCRIDILIAFFNCFLEAPAPTKLPESDDLPIENHGKDSDIKPASSRAVPGNSPQSAGSMVKDPGKESM